MQYDLLEEADADAGGEDAQNYVDDIVMAGVDGCPPDADSDDGAEGNQTK